MVTPLRRSNSLLEVLPTGIAREQTEVTALVMGKEKEKASLHQHVQAGRSAVLCSAGVPKTQDLPRLTLLGGKRRACLLLRVRYGQPSPRTLRRMKVLE